MPSESRIAGTILRRYVDPDSISNEYSTMAAGAKVVEPPLGPPAQQIYMLFVDVVAVLENALAVLSGP